MVVHHTGGLHVRIHDGAADKFETPLFQIFAQGLGLYRGGRKIGHRFPAVLNGFAANESPDVGIEAAELLLDL